METSVQWGPFEINIHKINTSLTEELVMSRKKIAEPCLTKMELAKGCWAEWLNDLSCFTLRQNVLFVQTLDLDDHLITDV